MKNIILQEFWFVKIILIGHLLKQSNIVIISIGMNDIYYKINDNTKEIYNYLNTMLKDYEELLASVSKYNYDQVIIMGYYNIYDNNNDLFSYINYKLRMLTNNYNYTYINTNKILHNNEKYYQKTTDFNLNNTGYNIICNLIVENLKKY